MIGFVYVISDNNRRFKVGFSANPEQRLRHLRTANAGQLHLVGQFPGDMNTERALHDRLREWRLQGEWFEATAAALAIVDDVLSNPPQLESLETRPARGETLSDRICTYLSHTFPSKTCECTARALSMSPATVRKWFDTGCTPGGETILRMIDVFGAGFYEYVSENPAEFAKNAIRETRKAEIKNMMSDLIAEYQQLVAEDQGAARHDDRDPAPRLN